MIHFHIITVVWGDAYVDLFLDFALPNQLTPGNLLFFAGRWEQVTYKILTTSADAQRIKAAPIFVRLSAAVPIEFMLIDDADRSNTHGGLTECHRRAIKAADAQEAALIFLSPDSIWSDGTFRRLVEIAESGKRAVFTAGIRVTKESFIPAYQAATARAAPDSAPLAPRQLVALALPHLHPFTRTLFWDDPEIFYFPSNLYWRVGDEGFLARCFHIHPLLVHPVRRGLLPVSTIDDDYLMLACPDPEDFYVVEDSDDLVGFEISRADHFGTMHLKKRSVTDVAFWARYHATPHHLSLAQKKLRFHQCDCSEAWRAVAEASDRVLADIDYRRRRPLLFLAPRILKRRMVRIVANGLRLFVNEQKVMALWNTLVRLKIVSQWI